MIARLAIAACVIAMTAFAARSEPGVHIGSLECYQRGTQSIIISAEHALDCTFFGFDAPERYTGTLTRTGIDIGTTDGLLMWAVVAPGNLKPGALAGSYGGASIEATAGIGGGINVLVGGGSSSITLQPLSFSAKIGANLALGATTLELRSVQ